MWLRPVDERRIDVAGPPPLHQGAILRKQLVTGCLFGSRGQRVTVGRGGGILGGFGTARLVLVHGIGPLRDPVRERMQWLEALAVGAKESGHSDAAPSLASGLLADCVFADYSDVLEAVPLLWIMWCAGWRGGS